MTTEPLRTEIDPAGGGCAVVYLEQPDSPVVVLDLRLIQRLETTLSSLPEGLAGVVLASASERVFVAGADLKSIAGLDDASLDRYLAYGSKVFAMLSSMPCPTAAAINGAALGGGLEIAMHCDGLVAAPSPSGKPYPVGLPEAGLSICPGWGGTNLLPARMDASEAITRTATGKPMTFPEAVEATLFDTVVEKPENLVATAREWVLAQPKPVRDDEPTRWIGRDDLKAGVRKAFDGLQSELSGDPAQAVLKAVGAGLDEGWQAALASERASLIRLRNEPAGREAIAAFFAKSAAKPAAKEASGKRA
ncbi:MAG: hypothetical protein EA423_08065 [Phycisphaerales bacterium]|nr:MAG: hypothetical protein EA423_08065 [Phycisphaerales bacterium]